MGFSWKKALSFVAPVVAIVAPEVIPFIGSSILGGAAAAEGVGAAIGLTASQVSSAVGSAALAAGSTAAAGGSVEDVFTAAASAGAASGINFAAGGGVTGAVAGSVAGTAIKGGDESQILTNALAAGVGAGVRDALPDNPDAGKIVGEAAKTYIATGGNIDQTLLNTAVTAVGVLDKKTPAPIESITSGKQVDANTIIGPSVAGTGDQMASTLAGMMSTEKPEISNVNDFKNFVDEELLKSQFAPTAQAQPLISQAGRMIGPAVGAAGQVLIPVAEEVVMPAALRFAANNPQFAAETAQYLNRMGMAGAAAAVVSSFGLSSDTLNMYPADLQRMIDQIPKSNLPVAPPEKFDPGTGTGWDAAKSTTAAPKTATTTAKVTDTGDETARLLARFPAPGAAPVSDLSVINGAEGDPIYTQLSASINSGIDPYTAIAQMAESARLYREDPAPYLDSLIDAAAVQGLDPQKSVDAVVATQTVPELAPSVDPNLNPAQETSAVTLTGSSGKPAKPGAGGSNLGNVAVVGGGDNVTGNVAVVGGGSNNAGNVVVDGGGGNLAGNVVIDDGGGNLSANVSANVVVTGGGVDDTGKDTSVDTGGDDTKSTTVQEPPTPIYPTVTQVPRPRKPVPTTITGPSPARLLADALSAYRPAGAVEGVESGKEREPVWNTESLRNALGI